MRAQVIYESIFGNTAAIAEAIADGLREYAQVEVTDVATAAESPVPSVDLLVVGGPTHAFGLSRARTRADAAAQTEHPAAVDIGIREWLDDAPPAAQATRCATFATKAATPKWLPGSAARGAGKRLRRLGYDLAEGPADFLVDGVKGPLLPGELERARAWAQHLAHNEFDRLTRRV
ncbi:flavodoxin domain-containing protein [Nocardia sp.]|uniref:flavodoxin family protein n=1 Tax=Nocardia sp. TaxID=1821 RepID=UPI002584D503|nr:flavodoxin domain-containing protein [Nocardia sp.]